MLFYIILLIAEVVAFSLLFVYIHLEKKDVRDEWKLIDQERRSLEYTMNEAQLQYKKCIDAYDKLVKMLEKDNNKGGSPPDKKGRKSQTKFK